jgi:hypothetical protein
MRRFLSLMGLLFPVTLAGQQPVAALRDVAEGTRALWHRQDAGGLVAHSPQLVIQLPGADPSAPVQRRQATELLRDFFENSEEVETTVTDARDLGGGRAFVEFKRRYRIRGTQDVREQLLLLSYRRSGPGWILVELRVGR